MIAVTLLCEVLAFTKSLKGQREEDTFPNKGLSHCLLVSWSLFFFLLVWGSQPLPLLILHPVFLVIFMNVVFTLERSKFFPFSMSPRDMWNYDWKKNRKYKKSRFFFFFPDQTSVRDCLLSLWNSFSFLGNILYPYDISSFDMVFICKKLCVCPVWQSCCTIFLTPALFLFPLKNRN